MTTQTKPGTPTASPEETITIAVREEIVSVYHVPVSRFLALELPTNNPRAEGEPYDEEQTMAALEGIEPIEYAVEERRISFPTDE
jgi:hypothetical protein